MNGCSSLVVMFGGFASYIHANSTFQYSAAGITYGLCFGNGGWDLVKDGWDENEWISAVGRHCLLHLTLAASMMAGHADSFRTSGFFRRSISALPDFSHWDVLGRSKSRVTEKF